MSQRKLYTVVFAKRESQLLLGMKKRGFGVGKWNGFGGKVEQNESIAQGAVRETEEECGLAVNEKDLNHIGHLEFTFQGEPIVMCVKVFTTFKFKGEPVETEEMRPKWFDVKSLPFNDMWPDDVFWFKYMLNEKYFTGKFLFQGYDTILEKDLKLITKEELLSLRD